jgi:hypothetical protein
MCACPLILLPRHHHEFPIPNRLSPLRSFGHFGRLRTASRNRIRGPCRLEIAKDSGRPRRGNGKMPVRWDRS